MLYAGFLSGVGVVLSSATLGDTGSDPAHAKLMTRRGLGLGVIACLVGVAILILRLGGQLDEVILSAVFASSTGAALVMQLVGAALVLAMPDDAESQFIRLGGAALILLAFGFSGHAATAGPFQGLFASLHTAAAAWWIGSLWILRHTCERDSLAVATHLVTRFSTLAVRVVGVLVVTGITLIYSLVDFSTFPALSDYQKNLLGKLALVVAVLSLATYNKFRLTPRLNEGDGTAQESLRRMIDFELIIIGAVLIATAVTTTYTSPHE